MTTLFEQVQEARRLNIDLDSPEVQAKLDELSQVEYNKRVTPEQARKIIMLPGGIVHEFIPPIEPGETEIAHMKRIREWAYTKEAGEVNREVTDRVNDMMDMVQLTMNQGHMFDVGAFVPQKLRAQQMMRDMKMYRAGHLPHPYSDAYLVFGQDAVFSRLILVIPHESDDFAQFANDDIRKDEKSVYLACFHSQVDGSDTRKVQFWLSAEGFFAPRVDADDGGIRTQPTDLPMMDDDAYILGELITCASMVLHTMMALNTRFVETEHVGTPIKLNEARIKRGKAPLPSYTRVLAEDYVTALSGHRSASHGDQGGTHASPLPHTRRAHVRTYNAPLRDGRLQILVREARVNMKSGRMGEVSRGHYQVKQ